MVTARATSTTRNANERAVDEETPLLRPDGVSDYSGLNANLQKETPIPWGQYSLILFLQLAEPMTSQVIYPFIPQLIRDIGVTKGDETKVGYYVGLMQSIFFATQAVTVLYWSRASDHVGRKPVILVGLFGLSLSMYCFGLSRTFAGLVVSWSLAGALNGNVGVVKSMLGEITDETNVGKAFAYLPIGWSTGATIGPLIGGALSRPADRFPNIFGDSEFLKTYPYFLPCAIPATFSLLAWFVTYCFLKETNPTDFRFANLFKSKRNHAFDEQTPPSKSALIDEELSFSSTSSSCSSSFPASRSPSPHRTLVSPCPSNTSISLVSLLTPRVLISAGNCALLSLVDISYRALQPVFLATPTRLGGLGLPPHTIGTCFAVLGFTNSVFQVLFFAKLLKWLGAKRLYVVGIASSAPIFALFAVMSVLVQRSGGVVDGWVWTALGVQLALTLLLNMSYSCIFIFITNAAPSKQTLGATNGLSQMTVSLVRTFGPACASSLYSLSLHMEYEQGKGRIAGALVYIVMLVFVGISVACGMLLPREMWKRPAEE